MIYKVKVNFKNTGIFFKIGQYWKSPSDEVAEEFLKQGLIEALEVQPDLESIDLPLPLPSPSEGKKRGKKKGK
jgi:hypothetical protein